MMMLYFVLLAVLILSYVLASLILFFVVVGRSKNKGNSVTVKLSNLIDENKSLIREKNLTDYRKYITFEQGLRSASGKIHIRFVEAEIDTKKTIICIHGYNSDGDKFISNFWGCYKDRWLLYNLCIPDFFGCGNSSGRFQTVGKKSDEVIAQAIACVRKIKGDDAEIYLHGVSLGAYNALGFLTRNHDVGIKGLIFDSGFVSIREQILYMLEGRRVKFLLPMFYVWYLLFFGSWYRDFSKTNMINMINVPILIFHAGKDDIVPLKNAQTIFDKWCAYKRFELIKDDLKGQNCLCNRERYSRFLLRFITDKHLNRIALIGVMGAGKTTLGAMLANKYNLTHIDTDEEIVRDTGKQLTELFAESESCFRHLEISKLSEVTDCVDVVLSCGGGTPQIVGSYNYLCSWTIIHLKIPSDVAFKRSNGIKKFAREWEGFKKLCESRFPLYDKLCDYIVITDHNEQAAFTQLCKIIDEHNLLKTKGEI